MRSLKKRQNIPSHLPLVSLCQRRSQVGKTYLRCAFLQGTHADATCAFVFLCFIGDENSGSSLGLSDVENVAVDWGRTCE